LKKFLSWCLFVLIILTYACPCHALGVSAHSAVLIEASTGKIMYEKNAHQKMSMASTTKIMTAICALENSELDKLVEVHPSSVGVEGSSIYLKHGEHLTVRELVYGLMLSSGNDAAVAIAYAVSGSVEEFAKLMNETAQKIGVKNTSFKNPNGLDEENHYTTAYDLAVITAYALKIKEFKEIVSTYEKTISHEGYDYDRKLRNHNKLLKMYEGCIGVKTGFTKKSGRCLVSAAERKGVTLVAVTLKAPDDWNDHMTMLNYGFERVKNEVVLKKDEYLKTVNVKGGMNSKVKVICNNDINIANIDGEKNKVTLKYNIKNNLTAPVGYRAGVGTVSVYLDGKHIADALAVTETAVKKDNRKTLKRSFELIFSEFINSFVIDC